MIRLLSVLAGLLMVTAGYGQDTFSIVAVDETTGEVGSAGASCLDDTQFPGSGGVKIICDVQPGVGAINTQSFYAETNQFNARVRMLMGESPQQIIDWLENNDVANTPDVRQYGIALLDSNGNAQTGAFTGVNCMDYKNHIIGPNYAIQGNILLGQSILDDMEAGFLNTQGTLAEKLMAALQGANVPGADTRCLSEGVSSLSAFLKVAKPTDVVTNLYLDLTVPSTPFGVEPLDSLQTLFDAWTAALSVDEPTINRPEVTVFPHPVVTNSVLRIQPASARTEVVILNLLGQTIDQIPYTGTPINLGQRQYPAGTALYQVRKEGQVLQSGAFVVAP